MSPSEVIASLSPVGQAAASRLPSDLPIRWHLAEGLILPDDLPALRAEVEREEEQKLVILDSAYNFPPAYRRSSSRDAAEISRPSRKRLT